MSKGWETEKVQVGGIFCLFVFLATVWHIVFSSQRSDQSCSCDLDLSCGSAGSFNCAGPGIEPESWCIRDAKDSIAPQGELLQFAFQLRDIAWKIFCVRMCKSVTFSTAVWDSFEWLST